MTRDVTATDVADALSGATVHIGVCRLVCEGDALVVYGEGDHRVGAITELDNTSEHLSREVGVLVENEHDQL